MKGDFTRNTFQPVKHFSRVMLQQGRVQLDADWNEQISILLHQMRMMAVDCFGAYGRPLPDDGGGFQLSDIQPVASPTDVAIGNGRYYVGGVLVENAGDGGKPYSYLHQPFWNASLDPLNPATFYFIYLDVWERLVTALEQPALREIALGGPDTSARAQVVWQVKAVPVQTGPATKGVSPKPPTPTDSAKALPTAATWNDVFAQLQQTNRGALQAAAVEPDTNSLPCVLPAASKYRGENQLWRVEIHRGGVIDQSGAPPATFKVSSDNGSIVYGVLGVDPVASPKDAAVGTATYAVKLTSLGRDSRTAIAEGDWVELVDDSYALESASDDRSPDPLLKVIGIDADDLVVTLQGRTSAVAGRFGQNTGPCLLRRWDQAAVLGDPNHSDDAVFGTFVIGTETIKLQPGIRLTFQATGADGKANVYRRGDYWLIPGREATGDIEWPADAGKPLFQPPRGIKHRYAPLAVIGRSGDQWIIEDDLKVPNDSIPVDDFEPEF